MKVDRAALKESLSDTIIATPLNLAINYLFLALLMSLEFGPVLISVIMTMVFFVIAIVRKYYVRTWFKKRQSR
jgi:ABC-type bacteriocin/lantibiotic exporter with double-glycine peptidase domain